MPLCHVSQDAANNIVVLDYWQDGANGKEERMSAPWNVQPWRSNIDKDGRINQPQHRIQTNDFDSLISADYGRRALRAVGEPATARNLAWLHKYVHIAHSDGSVQQAPILKVCLGGALSC